MEMCRDNNIIILHIFIAKDRHDHGVLHWLSNKESEEANHHSNPLHLPDGKADMVQLCKWWYHGKHAINYINDIMVSWGVLFTKMFSTK